jgi:AcrR family transcriptional regulator
VTRTREAVLRAGRELLDAEGPDAVTHLRVGEATGIARTTIYRHWADREALLAAVLTETSGDVAEPDTGDLRGDLHLYLEQIRHGTARRRERHKMAHVMARAETDRTFADLRRERIERRLAPLRNLLQRAVVRGDLAAGLDVEEAAIDFVADERIDAMVDAFLARHHT